MRKLRASGLPQGVRSLFNSIVHKLIVSEIAAPMGLRGIPSRSPQALALALTVCPAGNIFAVSGTILFWRYTMVTEDSAQGSFLVYSQSHRKMTPHKKALTQRCVKDRDALGATMQI